jgi:hypothetical protein
LGFVKGVGALQSLHPFAHDRRGGESFNAADWHAACCARWQELLGITPHQRRAILAAWQVYKQRVAAARQMSRSCIDGIQQVGVRQAAGRGAVLPETLSAIMQVGVPV